MANHFIYLSNVSKVKDLFLKHGGEEFKFSQLLKVNFYQNQSFIEIRFILDGYWNKNQNQNQKPFPSKPILLPIQIMYIYNWFF
jgi:hypothetical protein